MYIYSPTYLWLSKNLSNDQIHPNPSIRSNLFRVFLLIFFHQGGLWSIFPYLDLRFCWWKNLKTFSQMVWWWFTMIRSLKKNSGLVMIPSMKKFTNVCSQDAGHGIPSQHIPLPRGRGPSLQQELSQWHPNYSQRTWYITFCWFFVFLYMEPFEPRKKTNLLLSMKYWLVNRDPYNGLL